MKGRSLLLHATAVCTLGAYLLLTSPSEAEARRSNCVYCHEFTCPGDIEQWCQQHSSECMVSQPSCGAGGAGTLCEPYAVQITCGGDES